MPLIYFSTGTTGMLDQFNDIKPDILSVDWRTKLGDARKILNQGIGLQGNLDPYLVQYSGDYAMEEAHSILSGARGMDNYIFNLGHGVLPDTNPEILKNITDLVHSFI